jgi:hypothetical protein
MVYTQGRKKKKPIGHQVLFGNPLGNPRLRPLGGLQAEKKKKKHLVATKWSFIVQDQNDLVAIRWSLVVQLETT